MQTDSGQMHRPLHPDLAYYLARLPSSSFLISLVSTFAWAQASPLTATLYSISIVPEWLRIQNGPASTDTLLSLRIALVSNNLPGLEEALYTASAAETFVAPTRKGKIHLIHPTITFRAQGTTPLRVRPEADKPILLLALLLPLALSPHHGIQRSHLIVACGMLLLVVVAFATATSSKIGVSGFIQQFSKTPDIEGFLTDFRPDLPSKTTFAMQFIDGGSNLQSPDEAGILANLDIQYTVGGI
ncbi:hypothetical protein BU17DRAFT_92550 [Hysterangium stoloniferum]|nr:hypothetical protein BU17DRAFT_92550 [Hysterangium stoloniferum]